MGLNDDTWELDRSKADVPRVTAAPDARWPFVMVAHCDDLALVGAEVEVPANGLAIGRASPEFTQADGAIGTIDDPYVSRAHVRVRWKGSAFEVSARDGRPIAAWSPAGEPWPDLGAIPEGGWVTLKDRVLLCLTRRRRRSRKADRLGFVGESEALWKARDELAIAAKTDADVLVTGETGAGKEVAAQALHALGARSGQPLTSFNCGTFREGTMAVELFGSVRGAFTSAEPKVGAFERADKGSIFLDEIGELPSSVQAELLRVTEAGELNRVGSATQITVDVRLISATHQDLAAAVEAKRFRADLYYRLARFEVRLPALREHREDVPVLLAHFVRAFGGEAVIGWKREKTLRLPVDAVLALVRHAWPGNVRELSNRAKRIAAQLVQGDMIEVPKSTAGLLQPQAASAPDAAKQPELDRASLLTALQSQGFRRAATAKALGINRSTLYRWMTRFGLSTSAPSADAIQAAITAADGDLSVAAEQLQLSVRALVRHARAAGLTV